MTSYYYCIDPVLAQTEKDEAVPERKARALITVSHEPCPCSGSIDDCFVLANPVHIMRLDDAMAVDELAQLMKDTPLYHFNMQLVLDEALTERHRNKSILEALTVAFENRSLPETNPVSDSEHLRHPSLKKMEAADLSRIYVQFLMRLRHYKEDFSFQRTILGQQPDHFLQQFDGFFEEGQGKILSHILLAFGLRLDHDPTKPRESYIHNGQTAAQRKNISDPHELIWAWLECDHYQQRRCRDVHRAMSLTSLPRMPKWVRIDIFHFLERESMKQVFAEKLVVLDPRLETLAGTPQIKRAMRMNAAGQLDENLQHLLAQTVKVEPYSGAAARLADAAESRKKESHKIKLG